MTIQEMMQEAHEDAITKGFAGKIPRNQKEVLQLILSEIGEAQEAHRSDKRADLKAFEEDDKQFSSKRFLHYIKDSYEDELADILIRIGNYLREFNIDEDFDNTFSNTVAGISDKAGEVIYSNKLPDIDIAEYINNILEHIPEEPYNTGECLFNISCNIVGSYNASPAHRLADAVIDILRLAAMENIDLEKHVRYKMDYNKTRPHLHGKKY